MKKLNIISFKLPKKQLEDAIKAMQLYIGSMGTTSMRSQQRLYDKVVRLTNNIADKLGMDPNDVLNQVTKEAEKRGKIIPTPGKDI